jgi:hypothetical protein
LTESTLVVSSRFLFVTRSAGDAKDGGQFLQASKEETRMLFFGFFEGSRKPARLVKQNPIRLWLERLEERTSLTASGSVHGMALDLNWSVVSSNAAGFLSSHQTSRVDSPVVVAATTTGIFSKVADESSVKALSKGVSLILSGSPSPSGRAVQPHSYYSRGQYPQPRALNGSGNR